METAITLHVDDLELEGRLEHSSPARAAIFAHPHPLFGGDMDNAVVTCVAGAYRQAGWSTLRFNFRGTGQSTGSFADGDGEQQDLQSAIDHLYHRGLEQMDLVGYSFGAAVIARWANRQRWQPHRLVLVSPPVALMDFPRTRPLPGLHQIITGSRDDIAPVTEIRAILDSWHLPDCLAIIQGADHTYFSHHAELANAATKII